MREFYNLPIREALALLEASERGLSREEAAARLKEYGPNKLPRGKSDNLAVIFLRQFASPLIYVLIGAAALVLFLGEKADAIIIMAVLFFNAIAGAIQEGRAKNTLLALNKWSETKTTAIRDGKETIIADSEVAPGDILILEEGEKVPADSRIVFENNIKVDESVLTGESEPVEKTPDPIAEENLPVTERRNMLFKGTHILAGNAVALAVATGPQTEMGKIAKTISQIETEIPLKKNIRYLSRLVIAIVLLMSAGLILLGLIAGEPLQKMFVTAVALAVSVIPEGLPIVMTLILATGVWRMSKRNALVKRLQAVESLGQTRIIAVDKTGTITRNEMVLEKIYAGGKFFSVTGAGYEPEGDILEEDKVIEPLNHADLFLAAKTAAFTARARLSYNEEEKNWRVAGDPTEAAMVVFAEKVGFRQEVLEEESPTVFELPFDYAKKYHVVIRKSDDKNFLGLAGAPEKVMKLCDKLWRGGQAQNFGRQEKEEAERAFFSMAREGFRVVAYAFSPDTGEAAIENNIPSLIFGGFFGIRDALRPEVKQVVERVEEAGMKVIMITGDHRLTAEVIAREAGIMKEGDSIATGEELERMTDYELVKILDKTSVFARVTPAHKLRIIEAYRKRGEVVAMTGDGVNDAPSLVAADLGVAMGKIGTEVAKEAADIILLDDNIGSIVAAVEEGRSIYQTIKKVILYLFSTSAGEAFVIIAALFMALPLPLLPSQIIWLNFITDGFLVVALAMEPKEKNLIKNKFEKPKKWIVDKLMSDRIFLMAAVMSLGSVTLFALEAEKDLAKAWTICLTVLAVFQWFNAWNCRSDRESIFKMNPFRNPYLVAATALVVLFQIAAIYAPFMQKILRTRPISLHDWLIIILLSTTVILAEEIRKYFHRRKFAQENIGGTVSAF